MFDLGIIGLGITLVYTPTVVEEIECVINQNLDQPMDRLSLFISRLLKGLQGLSNDDVLVDFSWGQGSYEIEDIGLVLFQALFDPETGERALLVNRIEWQFETSRLFSSFHAE